MRRLIFILSFFVVTSCGSKSDNPKPDAGEKKLVKIKSSYQTYSFGNLRSFKVDWENWTYNELNQLSKSRTYRNYEYDDRLLIPYDNTFIYNSDGTIKEREENTLTSTSVYRFEYNNNKQPIKREHWLSSGLVDTETYVYHDGRLYEKKGSNIVVYSYENNGSLSSEEYFKDEKREPWFKYVYERDSKGNEIKKTQYNLDRNNSVVLNQASYEYDLQGQIIKKTFKEGVLGRDYIVVYSYNDKGQVSSQQVKRKLLSNYDDWMYITYEYIYE